MNTRTYIYIHDHTRMDPDAESASCISVASSSSLDLLLLPRTNALVFAVVRGPVHEEHLVLVEVVLVHRAEDAVGALVARVKRRVVLNEFPRVTYETGNKVYI